jgi:hypothetical protein
MAISGFTKSYEALEWYAGKTLVSLPRRIVALEIAPILKSLILENHNRERNWFTLPVHLLTAVAT